MSIDTSNLLLQAVARDDINEISRLLGEGADVNAKGPHDGTPLHLAALKDNLETVALLLASGAKVNTKDSRGSTPLHDAALAPHAEKCAELLLDAGADVNAKDNRGNTPLHGAVLENRVETVDLLLTRGADMHAENENGVSPLKLPYNSESISLLQRKAGRTWSNKIEQSSISPDVNSLEKLFLLEDPRPDKGPTR